MTKFENYDFGASELTDKLKPLAKEYEKEYIIIVIRKDTTVEQLLKQLELI